MHKLVPEDAAQLALVEDCEDTLSAAHGRVVRVAARRERVRCHGRGNPDEGHRLASAFGEFTHDSVKFWPFKFGDRVRIHRAQRQRRRVPVRVGGLRESDPREQEDPHSLPRPPRHERANAHQQRPHAAQQEGRLEAIVIVAVHHARDTKEVTWERPEKHPSHR